MDTEARPAVRTDYLPFGRRDELLLELRRRNRGATIHTVLHAMPLYWRGNPPASLPATEALGLEILTLPTSAGMTSDDIDYVRRHGLERTQK